MPFATMVPRVSDPGYDSTVPSVDRTRQRLTDLRNGLLKLHKAVLDSERDAYDHNIRRITSAGQLLDLVLNDPWFAWLRELSQFIVLIDETLDWREPATSTEADKLIARARELLMPAENGRGFGKSYFEAMQRDPSVVVAHGEMMKVFSGLSDG
jgi:hypothetical protein